MKKLVIAFFSLVIPVTNVLFSQVNLSIESLTVQEGDTFCLDVSVKKFQELISFQAQFLHDEELLTFHEFKNASFPKAIDNSSYANDARIAWVSKDLINGASLEEDSHLISVCYIAESSGVTAISIFNEPTEISWLTFINPEVYNAEEEEIGLVVQDGLIVIEEQDSIAAKDTKVEEENLSTSTFENDLLQFQLTPNPVKDFLKISSPEVGKKIIQLYSVNGVLLFTYSAVNQEIIIPTNHLQKGMYFVEVETEEGIVSEKIIKL